MSTERAATTGPARPQRPTGPVTLPVVAKLSVAERDRRWSKVRALMARDGMDVIVAPQNTGAWESLQANSRYLVGIGGGNAAASAIFPREGEVTALTGPAPPAEYWRGFQDWVTDVRPSFFAPADAIVERLRELGVERARIGIAGLAGGPRSPDGTITHGMYESIRSAFPDAELVNATRLLEEARAVKGAEEIAFMRQGVVLAERAIETFRREARPGVAECVVYARMLATMAEAGGELPTMLLWSCGSPQPPSNAMQASQRPLGAGDVFGGIEVEARWSGYQGQCSQPAIIGPASVEYKRMFAAQQEAIARLTPLVRPGHTMRELLAECEAIERDSEFVFRLIMHARGLGDDAPVVVFAARDPRFLEWAFEVDQVFVLKPVVRSRDWSKWLFWCDTVRVTEGGAERLGTRVPELIEAG